MKIMKDKERERATMPDPVGPNAQEWAQPIGSHCLVVVDFFAPASGTRFGKIRGDKVSYKR